MDCSLSTVAAWRSPLPSEEQSLPSEEQSLPSKEPSLPSKEPSLPSEEQSLPTEVRSLARKEGRSAGEESDASSGTECSSLASAITAGRQRSPFSCQRDRCRCQGDVLHLPARSLPTQAIIPSVASVTVADARGAFFTCQRDHRQRQRSFFSCQRRHCRCKGDLLHLSAGQLPMETVSRSLAQRALSFARGIRCCASVPAWTTCGQQRRINGRGSSGGLAHANPRVPMEARRLT
jgi:hypothetical protein